MKYNCEVNVNKMFTVSFPEALFIDEHMNDIRSFSEYYRSITAEELRSEIIEAWADGGNGYYEQFGCYISDYSWICDPNYLLVLISGVDVNIDDSFMEKV